jgi:hypothetical protein
MLDDFLNIGIVDLNKLGEPMNDLDIRVAPHLAEHRGPFDGLISDFVEFPEQGNAADLSHRSISFA